MSYIYREKQEQEDKRAGRYFTREYRIQCGEISFNEIAVSEDVRMSMELYETGPDDRYLMLKFYAGETGTEILLDFEEILPILLKMKEELLDGKQ